jgi:hypothetical protein
MPGSSPMNSGDRKKFSELMAIMGEVFQKDISKPLLRSYFTVLEKYPIEQIEQGINHIIATRTITGTIPLPAEIIAAFSGSAEDRAEIAWTALLWAIEHVGHPQSVRFEDPLIHNVVASFGGWLRVCSADGDDYNEEWHTKNLQWRRKDFITMYRIMLQRQTELLQYLPGLHEHENIGKHDEFIPRITLIAGNPGRYQALPWAGVRELPAPKQTELDNKIKHIVQKMDEINL